MLHNLCRGTGLAGTSSPTVFRRIHPELELVRPLLSCFRTTVIEYLSQLGQSYRSDSSNHDQAFRRNFLRHSVLPLLQQVYGTEVEKRLLSYSLLAEESLHLQRNLAKSYWLTVNQLEQRFVANDWLPVNSCGELRFPSRNLLAENWPVVQLAIQHHWQKRGWRQQAVTKKHWDSLKSVWQSLKEPTRFKQRALRSLYQLPQRIQVSTCNGWLLMQPPATAL
jgi:tRNA(Ile)-lysidine synthase